MHQILQRIKDSITEKNSCAGTLRVGSRNTILFYRSGNDANARCLNLSEATEEELAHLTKTCKPATFGRAQEDVLDETYRKAGKLDLTEFATTFDLASTGIMDIVKSELVEGSDEASKVVRPELYKLNVYDKGSFFKAHKDTPRAENMFASLVVVFATAHEGGSLVLRHKDQEWEFDSATEVPASTPSIGYIAFYSDIEHEVMPVTSGYRVTLTYNLYLDPPSSLSQTATSSKYTAIKNAVQELLDAGESAYPSGGRLGFGLSHQYPLSKSTKLPSLLDSLKGSDAAIYRACRELNLDVYLRLIYRVKDCTIMTKAIVDPKRWDRVEDYELAGKLRDEHDGDVIKSSHRSVTVDDPVEWITQPTKFNRVSADYIAYGNEASPGKLYGDMVLIVDLEEEED